MALISSSGISKIYFAINVCLAHTAGDKLRVLGAEIKNEDPVGMDVEHDRGVYLLTTLLLIHLIVGWFLGDRDIMDMALTHTGIGQAYEFRLGTHFVEVLATSVAHGHAYAVDLLVNDLIQCALVKNTDLDTFRHQFLDLVALLEIAIRGTVLLGHGAHQAHAIIPLQSNCKPR